jgi:hypothetical protein
MDGDPVISALAQQVECYRRLLKLSQVQRDFVQQSQTEQLLEVLMRRQEVMSQINELEAVIRVARKQWGAYLLRLTEEERERAQRSMDQTRVLLEQIMAADRDDVLVLQQQKLSVGRQINQASGARQVNRNYAVAAYGARQSSVDLQR